MARTNSQARIHEINTLNKRMHALLEVGPPRLDALYQSGIRDCIELLGRRKKEIHVGLADPNNYRPRAKASQ